jgi:hypothetical protein
MPGPVTPSAPNTSPDMLNQAKGLNQNMGQLINSLNATLGGKVKFGTFTCAAAASTTVSNSNVASNSFISWTPTTSYAGTLEGAATKLYISAIVPGTSFTVTTANGGSANTSCSFSYIIVNH